MSRRGCSLPANASGFDPHRASITSRFGQVTLQLCGTGESCGSISVGGSGEWRTLVVPRLQLFAPERGGGGGGSGGGAAHSEEGRLTLRAVGGDATVHMVELAFGELSTHSWTDDPP
jgi:hypothetical protein